MTEPLEDAKGVAPRLRLSDLLGARVVGADGRVVGRVRDVRARREDDRFLVEGLVLGTAGIRARLGTRAARRPEPLHEGDLVPWDRVAEIAPGVVRLRAG
ncbi:PRC-barrel domain-containing protein [Patulibacter brassicae]|jgi:sporulation protein YlmC with PRC-barrel domain|uniref:PRC-barrel domain-containing protein n=1 Tax=Patulibacter brassicae TaxID=1705717 RepID=A0ABU4VNA9_9ACTN|nr:PRC-barrel domain-containing protein [Patulibacter brassicae]MDX8152358.1 PRC-barrel domain-containing protein [Patulibacter brassicae]